MPTFEVKIQRFVFLNVFNIVCRVLLISSSNLAWSEYAYSPKLKATGVHFIPVQACCSRLLVYECKQMLRGIPDPSVSWCTSFQNAPVRQWPTCSILQTKNNIKTNRAQSTYWNSKVVTLTPNTRIWLHLLSFSSFLLYICRDTFPFWMMNTLQTTTTCYYRQLFITGIFWSRSWWCISQSKVASSSLVSACCAAALRGDRNLCGNFHGSMLISFYISWMK